VHDVIFVALRGIFDALVEFGAEIVRLGLPGRRLVFSYPAPYSAALFGPDLITRQAQ
jgi:hypothetical protein